MYDYGLFQFESKQELFDKAIRYWNPDKTKFWQKAGIDLVIDKREGYCLYDMSGRRLIDLHLNGGTYNFGHRHPELVDVTLDRGQVGQRPQRPDYRRHDAGGGVSTAPPRPSEFRRHDNDNPMIVTSEWQRQTALSAPVVRAASDTMSNPGTTGRPG